ncbi:FMN-binding protein [Micromonospora sp. WMMD980]|uniref:FMN-binding protein n=1 Tax=Micromonospora sp. WMMD980 TaxID=3016088 RepID=UPI002415A86B|nr:FMN-binding protein [Micromonospora sp. WMMD980]MDG4799420.1 FMN-binding protein [Micromonospora sp. WMMD980]
MRRALLAITGLAAGTTALVVLKGGPGAGSVTAQDVPAAQAPVTPGGSPAPGDAAPSAAAPSVSATPGAAEEPSAKPSAERTPATRTSTRTRTAPAAPRTTTTAPRVTTRTVTGPTVTYRYGSLRVQITLNGSRIVDATGLDMPVGGQEGQRADDVQARYSGSSGEVVAKQSANLSTVSGATYTSTAYQRSLQAALDKA